MKIQECAGNLRLWMPVFLLSILIFITIPLARSMQAFVYDNLGREFFFYFVFFVIVAALAVFIYLLVFRYSVRKASRYIWLMVCAGLYGFMAFTLRENAEEAVHLIEYGLLSFFIFRAASCSLEDWTAYPTSGFSVMIIGGVDEYIQWLMPERVWDYRDIAINTLAGLFFLLAFNRVVKPSLGRGYAGKRSVRILAGMITVNLVFFALSLTATPPMVKKYIEVFDGLSWLEYEEPMTEFGYVHEDSMIGKLHSRLTLDELRTYDYRYGETYGRALSRQMESEEDLRRLTREYTPYNNPFLHEFIVHAARRYIEFDELSSSEGAYEKTKKSDKIYRENLVLEKYFKKTLKYSGLEWPDERIGRLEKDTVVRDKDYHSRTGSLITLFSLKTALIFIVFAIVLVWTAAGVWCRRIGKY